VIPDALMADLPALEWAQAYLIPARLKARCPPLPARIDPPVGGQ